MYWCRVDVLLFSLFVISNLSLVYASIIDQPTANARNPINGTTNYRSPSIRGQQGHHRNRTAGARGHDALVIRLPSSSTSKKKRQRHRINQLLSSTIDPSAIAINNGTSANGNNEEDEVQLRKALRQKRRKLKRLWQEIDRIQRTLKGSSGPSATDGGGRARNTKSETATESNPTAAAARVKNRKAHWRRRMMQRLKLLSRQLKEQKQRSSASSIDTVEKLYALLAMDPSADGGGGGSIKATDQNRRHPNAVGRKVKKNRGGPPRPFNNSTASPIGSNRGAEVVGNRTAQQRAAIGGRKSSSSGGGRMGGTKTAANVIVAGNVERNGGGSIKKGEAGSICTSHKNCKPGFCCHQSTSSTSSAKSTANATNTICVEHRSKQGESCANSCQCDSGLQCFISRKDKLYHKRLPPPDSSSSWSASSSTQQVDEIPSASAVASTDGQCKIPAMDDVLHGTYIIGDQVLFKANP